MAVCFHYQPEVGMRQHVCLHTINTQYTLSKNIPCEMDTKRESATPSGMPLSGLGGARHFSAIHIDGI